MTSIGTASWPALGTTAHVLVVDDAALPAAEAVVRRLLVQVDETYSRFRPGSELSALNASGGRRIPVSALLFEAIETAIRAAQATGGAVDPTIGHTLALLGYDRDFAALPADGPALAPRIALIAGWQSVRLDATTRTVQIPRGVALDLGSTGKALAADLAAAAAHAATGTGVVVSLGGDIATAGPPPPDGWHVHCSDDSRTDPTSAGEIIAIHGDAVATSSTTVRRWTNDGMVRHHIVDPATGLPAEGPWRSATVVARTCVDANAASTAAIVLGDRAIEWLLQVGVPARLTNHDGRITRIGGWPEPLEPEGRIAARDEAA